MEAISHPFLIFQLLVNVFFFGGVLFLIFMVFSSTIVDFDLRNLRKPETNMLQSGLLPFLNFSRFALQISTIAQASSSPLSPPPPNPPRCFIIQRNKLLYILQKPAIVLAQGWSATGITRHATMCAPVVEYTSN